MNTYEDVIRDAVAELMLELNLAVKEIVDLKEDLAYRVHTIHYLEDLATETEARWMDCQLDLAFKQRVINGLWGLVVDDAPGFD